MRSLFLAGCLALSACAGGAIGGIFMAPHAALTATSPTIVAALSDARRPATDTARDAARRPAETLAFAHIAPGAKVGEIFPGGGYFTRLFSVAVGESGKVYAYIRPDATVSQYETPILPVATLYPNVTVVRGNYDALSFPEPVDVIFTAQNYHDIHIASYHMGDTADTNRTAFAALRPGGVYVIIDHSAVDGSGATNTEALHRIDQALVRREVEAAGFVFDGESQVLRNPADPRTAIVFDPSIRGHTDQFMLRFRKPV